MNKKEEIENKRKSKDSKINRENKRLCEFLEKQGWLIMNGDVKLNKEGKWAYSGERKELVMY